MTQTEDSAQTGKSASSAINLKGLDTASPLQSYDDETDDATMLHGDHGANVGRASYPIPEPLSRILSRAIRGTVRDRDCDDDAVLSSAASSSGQQTPATPLWRVETATDTIERALGVLFGNSFQALDNMFFQTPAKVRNRTTFRHRLCLRVHLDRKERSLSVTDMGCGMTRADLINVFGVGSRLSQQATRAAAVLAKIESEKLSVEGVIRAVDDADFDLEDAMADGEEDEDENDEDDDDGDPGDDEESSAAAEYKSTDDGSGSSSDIFDGEDMEEYDAEQRRRRRQYHAKSSPFEQQTRSQPSSQRENQRVLRLPCSSEDIGGFYSALCALAVGANVGTKYKFDDYYEFEVGLRRQPDGTIPSKSNFSHFTITRPMEEGTRPSVENGYNRFSDVRGECGTRITLFLNARAISAGLLDETVMKPMLIRIFETIQYTVAFSSDRDAQSIIDASRKEEEEKDEAAGEKYDENDLDDYDPQQQTSWSVSQGSHCTVKERSKYIPLRLSLGERKMLRLVEAAMACCDYTTNVDRQFKSAARRTHAQLKNVSAVLRGMVIACDYSAGQKLLDEGNYVDYEQFFRQMFEIARRHKIMNPEKMRTEYGKLVYLLQDAVSPSVRSNLGFSCKGPIETVYKFLEERNSLALLDDQLIEIATQEILAEKKSRNKINAEIKRKEKAVAALKATYRSSRLSSEDIHLCLYSICDNNSFLNSNRVPIDKVIGYLKKIFSPDKIKEGYSLSIVSGVDGSRLSHSHERQYYFALQSLTLWRDIVDDMFRLWHMAEEDLLSESVTYALKDTGQGMQRVQQSPRTYKDMQKILGRVQGKVNKWIGSSVIHMGDHNVPNALSFIDKYTQVPRILGPIVNCLENLERICDEDDAIKSYVQSAYGGLEKLKKDILYDFFKSAFDGSGADNFYDAGSCIDGRLTSAWNWCSQLSTKPYYPIFKLTGFIGFDGEFK